MYARSTTLNAQLASIDAGIAYIRDEVLSALRAIDGFVGLSMMVDRESGLCIATSAWTDEDAMRASTGQVGLIRDRAAGVLGGNAEVEEWEIAVLHRDHPTHEEACVRAAWLQTQPSGVDGLIDTYRSDALPRIEQLEGFCSASFMVNRSSGRAVSCTCFESQATMQASRETADQIRAAGTQKANATILDVRELELAVAHLRVPEMA